MICAPVVAEVKGMTFETIQVGGGEGKRGGKRMKVTVAVADEAACEQVWGPVGPRPPLAL